MNLTTAINFSLISIVIIALTACGGGGGGSSSPPSATETISGTAAAGAPIVGSVTIKDSTGALRYATIAADGNYSVDVSDLTPPFMIMAEGSVGGRLYTLFSAATAADINGTINVTPLTDLIVANVARQVAENYFDNGNFSSLTASELNAAEDTLQQRLQDVLDDIGVAQAVDLLRTAFRTDSTGLDAALDILRVTVDVASNTATIENVLNNASIIDDLASNTDVDVITASGTTTGMTDWQAIQARFASFEAAFASGLPSASDPVLLAQFDQTGFLDNGETFNTFISDLTTDPSLVGIQFGPLSLISLTPASASQDGTALVAFSVVEPPIGPDYDQIYMTGIYDSTNNTTNWVIAGNQQVVEFNVCPVALLGFNQSNVDEIESGLDFNIEKMPTSTIDYAVVTGPGLPASGGGRDANTAGVLMVPNPFGLDEFWIVPSPYTGPLDTVFDTLTDIHTRAQSVFDIYTMTSAEVTGLPANNLEYSVQIYDDNSTPADLTDDLLLATYNVNVLVPPLAANTLSTASFPEAAPPTSGDIDIIAFTGGTLNLSWTLPDGIWAAILEVGRMSVNANRETFEMDLDLTSTSTTLQISAPSETIVSIWGTIGALDYYHREYARKYTL